MIRELEAGEQPKENGQAVAVPVIEVLRGPLPSVIGGRSRDGRLLLAWIKGHCRDGASMGYFNGNLKRPMLLISPGFSTLFPLRERSSQARSASDGTFGDNLGDPVACAPGFDDHPTFRPRS